MSASAAKEASGALGASRSLSLLLLLARFASGSAEFGVGIFDGGGIAVVLPLLLRAGWLTALFSLSDENDAAGDGESEAGFTTRRLSFWMSSSLSDASGDVSTARRAISMRDKMKTGRYVGGDTLLSSLIMHTSDGGRFPSVPLCGVRRLE